VTLRYITWRAGRPRFNPSSRERALGFKSHDLKYPDGRWLTYEEAQAYGEAIYTEIIAKRAEKTGKKIGHRARPKLQSIDRGGYVYFMFCGDEVKIGYSLAPIRRQAQLMTALPREPDTFFMRRGTRAHERAAHRELAQWRVRGEWFRRVPELIAHVQRLMDDDTPPTPANVWKRRDEDKAAS